MHKLVPRKVWERRYQLINDWERLLCEENGTTISKSCLVVSKEEQLRRFAERLDDPHRQWKISDPDYKERTYFDDYLAAFDEALERTRPSTPWFTIPCDAKAFRNLAVARIVLDAMEGMKLKYPSPPSISHRFGASIMRRPPRLLRPVAAVPRGADAMMSDLATVVDAYIQAAAGPADIAAQIGTGHFFWLDVYGGDAAAREPLLRALGLDDPTTAGSSDSAKPAGCRSARGCARSRGWSARPAGCSRCICCARRGLS